MGCSNAILVKLVRLISVLLRMVKRDKFLLKVKLLKLFLEEDIVDTLIDLAGEVALEQGTGWRNGCSYAVPIVPAKKTDY